MSFLEETNFHDYLLTSIQIDRTRPGIRDVIKVTICSTKDERYLIEFKDVYFASLSLNFAIVAEEGIYSLDVIRSDDTIIRLKTQWGASGADFSQLRCFMIRTNSTNSEIKIYALAYSVVKNRT